MLHLTLRHPDRSRSSGEGKDLARAGDEEGRSPQLESENVPSVPVFPEEEAMGVEVLLNLCSYC
jgi:hypothetical protein